MPIRNFPFRWFALAVLTACGGSSSAQSAGEAPPPVPARALFTAPMAGQKVAVLPLTLVVAQPPVSAEAPFPDRAATLAWSDSLLKNALENRAPDVSWVFPEQLRATARRAPTMVQDPDRMGQSVMASPRLDMMPDPLRTYARSLVALAGGRHLLIPAAFSFSLPDTAGVKAELAIVLADARNGRVLWRTQAIGRGPDAAAAVAEALRTMLPLPTEAP